MLGRFIITSSLCVLTLSACSSVAEKSEEYSTLACNEITSLMRSYEQQGLSFQNEARGRGDNTDLQDSHSHETTIDRQYDRMQQSRREEIAALRLAYKNNGCGDKNILN